MNPLHFIFPSFCPHCGNKKGGGLFCLPCSEEIQLLDEEPPKPPSLLNDLTIALEMEGAALTLHRLFTKRYTYLTDPISSLLYTKILKMHWPPFQIVYPVARAQTDRLLCKGLQRQMGIKNRVWGSLYDKNILMVSTRYHQAKIKQEALFLSQLFPRSIYSISVWNDFLSFMS